MLFDRYFKNRKNLEAAVLRAETAEPVDHVERSCTSRPVCGICFARPTFSLQRRQVTTYIQHSTCRVLAWLRFGVPTPCTPEYVSIALRKAREIRLCRRPHKLRISSPMEPGTRRGYTLPLRDRGAHRCADVSPLRRRSCRPPPPRRRHLVT